jgi:ankyrin repeat protein
MASDRVPQVSIEALPSRPNLEMQQKRARRLLRDAAHGDRVALQRIAALHPKPPAPGDLQLADAQLVVARGYGFDSWPALRRKIDSITRTPVDQFRSALHAGDADEVRSLLERHADVRNAVNQPIGPFGSRPASMARKNLPVLDVLLEYGADLNLKSDWAQGPFGLLEHDITPREAAPLIARGAVVDIFAAAHLGMFDRVRALVDAAPSLVSARGGDGKTALHCATSVEIAGFLLERGAAIDARDVDHGSTAAQYLIRDAPDVVRMLVDRGAWFDIFIAVGLRDRDLVERALRDDPDALDHRTWQGKYTTIGVGRPPTPEEVVDHRGDIYRWVFGHNVSAIDATRILGFSDMERMLLSYASPIQRLLAACAAADRSAADEVVSEHPAIVSALTSEQMRLIADRAHANDTDAVLLMLDLGFDACVPGPDDFEAIRWAVFLGNAELTRRLLQHSPPINTPDRRYGGTLLGNCLYGALHGWGCDRGDFATTVRLLLEAGERVKPAYLPTGDEDLDALLRAALEAQTAPSDGNAPSRRE